MKRSTTGFVSRSLTPSPMNADASFRAREDRAHDQLLAAGAREQRAAVEVGVVAVVVELQRDGVHGARRDAQLRRERRDGLRDAGGHEMHVDARVLQRGDRLLGAVDERRDVALRRAPRRPRASGG